MAGDRRRTLGWPHGGVSPALAAALALAVLAPPAAQAQLEIAEEVEEAGVDAPEAEREDHLPASDLEPGVQPVAPDEEAAPGVDALGAPERAGEERGVAVDIFGGGGATASKLLHVPVINHLFPGVVPTLPEIENPVADDPAAVHRGMRYYNQFNCIGCHAPNGAGGMGPSLSNSVFIYGHEPENIFLSIVQGRPGGMPAWGGVLPDQIVWDLVTYIKSISKDQTGAWGARISADGWTTEQVPAEYMSTPNPWQYLQPFSYGQAPFEKPKGAPPLETPTESLPPE